MPNGTNHWIDAGYNPDPEFSPSLYVAQKYGKQLGIDFLIISHPDKDHFDDLDTLLEVLGPPRVFLRNTTLPPDVKYDSARFAYQKAFIDLDTRYNTDVDPLNCPTNSFVNGGVSIATGYLHWTEVNNINNSSVVALYQYADTAIFFPGDIEDIGWKKFEVKFGSKFEPLLSRSDYRILVAPHHGRGSGYSEALIDFVKPSLIIVSDEYGREPTDPRFRQKGSGIVIEGELTRFISTKTNGRARIVVEETGLIHVD
jgi:competence protein ComEC